MPTGYRPEDTRIQRFLSVYENGSWADAEIDWPDKTIDGAVDALATRRSDRRKLAIEHTIIEPFVGEMEDYHFFKTAFLGIEDDRSLPVPGRRIQVFVPVGTLRGQRKQAAQKAIVEGVRSWLRTNRLSLGDGNSVHQCAITGIPGKPAFCVRLSVKVVPLQRGSFAERGVLQIRRQQTVSNLGKVVEKALQNKVAKLVNTEAHKRILLLERQHMNLYPEWILKEIERRKATFPDLSHVHEIWFVETFFYGTDFGGSSLFFERYEDGTVIESLDSQDADPLMRSGNGTPGTSKWSP